MFRAPKRQARVLRRKPPAANTIAAAKIK